MNNLNNSNNSHNTADTIPQPFLWQQASDAQYDIASLFKDIFIDGDIAALPTIFVEPFGLHNGYSKDDYIAHEMDEFSLKCQNFGLTKQSIVCCYDLGKGYIYFSLGKKEDAALFEAIFLWDNDKQKLKGNGYQFKIEPKIQIIQENNQTFIKRRINLTPPENSHTKIRNIIIQHEADNFQLIKSELPVHLGGNFYSIIYDIPNETEENCFTFWDTIKIFTSEGIVSAPVLMRGIDHPLFASDLILKATPYSFECEPSIYPVVVYVLTEDGKEFYYKYPEERSWVFEHKVKTICLTDSLSLDWIMNF